MLEAWCLKNAGTTSIITAKVYVISSIKGDICMFELANSLVVVDFETTGLSPENGDRAIEIGAVKLVNGEVVDTFQALMNPGRRVDSFIESYTGISNAMLADAEPCAVVMKDFSQFLGNSHLLAHNASFDKKFLEAEFARIDTTYSGRFLCSLLLARRIFLTAPNYKLATLINFTNIAENGHYHRALYDAQMTAKLWTTLLQTIEQKYSLTAVDFSLLETLQKTPKHSIEKAVQRWQLTQ